MGANWAIFAFLRAATAAAEEERLKLLGRTVDRDKTWEFDSLILLNEINSLKEQRSGLFVPGFDRLFVAVPHRGLQSTRVLVYKVKGD